MNKIEPDIQRKLRILRHAKQIGGVVRPVGILRSAARASIAGKQPFNKREKLTWHIFV